MADVRHLKCFRVKNRQFSATIQAIGTKFGRMTHGLSVNPNDTWNFEFFNPRWWKAVIL